MCSALLPATLCLFSWGGSALASQAPALDPQAAEAAFTEAVLAELEASSPAAAQLLRQADAARALGDRTRAGELYAQAAALAPDSDHPLRRHCTVLQEAGLRTEALPRCERALSLSGRPENRVALAFTLLDLPSGAASGPADLARAHTLLDQALAQAPDDPMNARLRCHLASRAEDTALLRACVADLERLAPDHVMTGFHAWELAFRDQRWADALAALDRAQAAGMPASDADSFRALTRDARPAWMTWGPALAVGALAGALSFVLLQLRGRRAR
ncbi:hypothetical protein L6R53_10800 [Myxococcota bacterium]|nr:hypothetical protein [Myxococcota bacterium]